MTDSLRTSAQGLLENTRSFGEVNTALIELDEEARCARHNLPDPLEGRSGDRVAPGED